MKPHKHATLIHAWAEGNEIECYDPDNKQWHASKTPSWLDHLHYRIKPKKPEWYKSIPEHGVLCWVSTECNPSHDNFIRRVYRRTFCGSYSSEGCGIWRYATPLTNDEIRQFLRNE